jgi:adenosylhomocysteine nucleosidase
MKKSFIVVVALESELSSKAISSHIPLVYSGIGKVNAAIATFKAIKEYQPDFIINFGTVGKINSSLSGLIKIGSVIQRDMMAEPLAPRGVVPFSSQPNKYISSVQGYVCGTGDSFVTKQDDWLIENGVDVVDMELFSIAAVARAHNLNWVSYKFISDEANENSGQKWSSLVNHGQELFIKILQDHLGFMDR